MPPFTTKQIFGLHNTGDRILVDLLICNTTETAHFIHSEFDIVHTSHRTIYRNWFFVFDRLFP